jgi:hypothetical protein
MKRVSDFQGGRGEGEKGRGGEEGREVNEALLR